MLKRGAIRDTDDAPHTDFYNTQSFNQLYTVPVVCYF